MKNKRSVVDKILSILKEENITIEDALEVCMEARSEISRAIVEERQELYKRKFK